jgi:hypothetical protein
MALIRTLPASPRIQILKPRASARDLVDQLGTLIEELRWQRADALILALEDHPLKDTVWRLIDEVLRAVPAPKQAAEGTAATTSSQIAGASFR